MSLDKKKRELELARVRLARQEMEFKIEERLAEIDKLKEHIDIQKKREEDLNKEI
jgi:hypothetical protein